MNKKCDMCGVVKDVDLFGINKSALDGHDCKCKACRATKNRQRYLRRKKDGVCTRCGKEKPVEGHPLCEDCWFRTTAWRVGVSVDDLILAWTGTCPYTGEKLSPYNASWIDGIWVSPDVKQAIGTVGRDKFEKIVVGMRDSNDKKIR